MFKKTLLTLTAFAIALFAATSNVSAANDLKVDWTAPTSFIGNVAQTTITVTNTSSLPKDVKITTGAFKCNWGTVIKPCGDNRDMSKATPELLTLGPNQSVTRSLSQNTPTPTCGSAQVDFDVYDLTANTKQGPFWAFVYTGNDCDTGYPFCPTPGAALVAPGKPWNGKTPDVSYQTGFHWIAGKSILREGADYVYYLDGSLNNVLQCFYPKDTTLRNIQTDWVKKSIKASFPHAASVENGADFGLAAVPYWARNTFFR